MTQNIYDNPAFFAGYATLDRSIKGLDGAPEWPTMQTLRLRLRLVLPLRTLPGRSGGSGAGCLGEDARKSAENDDQ